MDPATKEKLKPYFKVYAIYVAAALIWGRFFLGATGGMLYGLVICFFLTPLLASITAFLLAAKTNFLTAVAALLIYAATNNQIQKLAFSNSLQYLLTIDIERNLVGVVLVPGVFFLLLGALKKYRSKQANQ